MLSPQQPTLKLDLENFVELSLMLWSLFFLLTILYSSNRKHVSLFCDLLIVAQEVMWPLHLPGVRDGLPEAPQPSPDCAVFELGGGVLPAGAVGRPPVAWRGNERRGGRTLRDFPSPGAYCTDAAWPARRPRHPEQAAPQPAHHQWQHNLRSGPEDFLSHCGVAGILPAGGQCLGSKVSFCCLYYDLVDITVYIMYTGVSVLPPPLTSSLLVWQDEKSNAHFKKWCHNFRHGKTPYTPKLSCYVQCFKQKILNAPTWRWDNLWMDARHASP